MKKLRIVLLCVLFSCLIGCSFNGGDGTGDRPDLNKSYKVEAEITYGNFKGTAGFNRQGTGCWDVELSEPKSLEGMTLQYDNNDISVNYKGLTLSLSDDSTAVKTITSLIIGALENAATDSGLELTANDDAITLSGESEDGRYSITADKNNGALISMTMPEFGIDVKFASADNE